MQVILNDEPLEEVDCLMYLGRKWQLQDIKGVCVHRMNEEYRV